MGSTWTRAIEIANSNFKICSSFSPKNVSKLTIDFIEIFNYIFSQKAGWEFQTMEVHQCQFMNTSAGIAIKKLAC